MRKTILLSAFVAILFCTASCGDTKTGGGQEEDKPSYLLSKIKDANGANVVDFIEVKYASTDPVSVSELSMFFWSDESSVGAKRRAPKTKAPVLDDKTLFNNIVYTAGKMTLDVEMQESNGNIEKYGSYDITLDAQGRATLINFTTADPDNKVENNTTTVTYTADGYVSKFACSTGVGDTETYEYTYSGGNITKLVNTYTYKENDETKEEKLEAVFTDFKTDNKGGIMNPAMQYSDGMFDVFTSLHILGNMTAKLPSKADWGDGDIDTYTYEMDANGCVSKMTSVETYTIDGVKETDTEKYAYEYIEVAPKK